MEPEELKKLRQKLVERRAQLIAEGDLSFDPNRPDAATALDEDAQPLNEMNQVITSRRNRLRAEEIQRIEAALARIDADPDEFGICQECEEEIGAGRLEIMPWAALCVSCQAGRQGNERGGRRRHAGDFID